jgi:UDP-N-acetylmuramoyl-tripeptide--D-alanyl-D-alanine ligase
LGVGNSNIINSLFSFSILKGRGNTIKKGNITIIDDTYNANLASMKCGIENLKLKKNKDQDVVLIIGDMLDLGEDSKDLHSELGKYISGLNFIDSVYCVGQESRFVIENINNKKINLELFKDINSIITFLDKYDNSSTIFYIKGSRGMYMEKIIEQVFN